MDLVVTVSRRHTVDVWRFNGQRVFGLSVDDDDDRKIEGLAWREDGEFENILPTIEDPHG